MARPEETEELVRRVYADQGEGRKGLGVGCYKKR